LVVDVNRLGQVKIPATSPVSGVVSVAVRPEKIKLYTTCPGDTMTTFAAKVHHVAYYGNQTQIFVHTESGIELTATLPNTSRHGDLPMLGDPVWVGWVPDEALVLVN
jgi:hypothetical protein